MLCVFSDGGLADAALWSVLAVTKLGVLWGFLAFLLGFISLALILIILIQDPKGGGLSSAFGGGPGGESLLGAQAQKDVTRFTGILSCAFVIVLLAMVLIDNHALIKESVGGFGAGALPTEAGVEAGPPGTGDAAPMGDPSTPAVPPGMDNRATLPPGAPAPEDTGGTSAAGNPAGEGGAAETDARAAPDTTNAEGDGSAGNDE